jgi:hypothetical protein
MSQQSPKANVDPAKKEQSPQVSPKADSKQTDPPKVADPPKVEPHLEEAKKAEV